MEAPWRFAAAAVTGAAHARSGLPGQDRWACRVLPGGTLVAAVADGAGSALRAAEGAELAVRTVVDGVSAALAGEEAACSDPVTMLRTAVEAARAAVLALAAEAGQPVRAYASTLLAVVLGPTGGALSQLGDGVVLVSDAADDWAWGCWPQKGEYANTTFFLTDDGALDRLVVEALPAAVTDVALLTDGLEALALHYAETAVHRPFITRMVAPLHRAAAPVGQAEVVELSAALGQFLGSPAVTSRTDDDATLLMATRRPVL